MRLEVVAELGHGHWSVLCAHALHTSTDADFNHSCADGVGDLDACLQTGAALSVQGVDGCAFWEAGSESSCTELGSATAWCEDVADCDIFDQLWVDAGALDQSFEGTGEEISAGGVLEASTASLGDSSSQAGGDHDIVWVLLEEGWSAGGSHVRADLGDAIPRSLVVSGLVGHFCGV
jgi:hypothetical protein